MAVTTPKVPSSEDLDQFLDKVDEFDSIMKSLVNPGEEKTQDVLKKADDFIEKVSEVKAVKKYKPQDNTGVNRSVINKKAFQDESPAPAADSHTGEGMDIDAYMKAMEADVAERGARKRESKKAATVIKLKGNEQYTAGNYEAAIEHYTEALTLIKDMPALYTNRAQAYIKLGEYQKAIDDCDWALRASKDCIKAYIHMGRAKLALKQYDDAIDCYNQAIEVDPKKENTIRTYIAEAERVKRVDCEEDTVKKSLEENSEEALSLVDLMKKINKANQLPIFYSGGLRILAKKLNNTDDRTLFRINGGLKIPQSHPLISQYFTAEAGNLSAEQLDVCTVTLQALAAACVDNEENQRQLLSESDLCVKLLDWLQAKDIKYKQVQGAVISLLHVISENTAGSVVVMSSFDFSRLLVIMLRLMTQSGPIGVASAGFLNNLALCKEFKMLMQNELDAILPSLNNLLKDGGIPDKLVLPHVIAILTNISTDSSIRQKLTCHDDIWQFCASVLEIHIVAMDQPQNYEMIFSVLGVLNNLTVKSTDQMCTHAERLCGLCCCLVSSTECVDLLERVCGVLAALLHYSASTVDHVCQLGLIPNLLSVLKKHDTATIAKPVTRCFAACTKSNLEARTALSRKQGLATLLRMVKHKDELVVGNAALCLTHCCEVDGVCRRLTKTSIVLDLLIYASGGNKHAVQHNCAILLAKLSKGDPRHLARLKELDGLGVLHTVIQHIK